jgi:cell wall-associated NlpC family hydrolase
MTQPIPVNLAGNILNSVGTTITNVLNVNNGVSSTQGTNPVANNNNAAASTLLNAFGFDPFAPLQMKTLVYSPDVRVVIENASGTQYDVSKDLIRGTIVRKENSASSLFVTLSNKAAYQGGPARYNGLFDRMDKIVCYLKKTDWTTVFTGYLDTVPYAQMYPGMVEIKATCTLKRLIHTWWNPALPACISFFDQYGYAAGVHGLLGSAQGPPADTGLGNMLADILNKVGGWAPQDLMIQDFPMQFLNFLNSSYGQMEATNQMEYQNFQHMLLGDDISGGVGAAAGKYQSPYGFAASSPGPYGLGQPFYVQQICAAVDQRGLGPSTQDLTISQQLQQAGETGMGDRNQAAQQAFTQIQQGPGQSWQQSARNSDAAILAVACAFAETNMMMAANLTIPESLNYPHEREDSPDTSLGLFQQLNSWGSVSDRMNALVSAGMFLDHLPPDWRNADPATAIASAQGNQAAYARYQSYMQTATQLVQQYRQSKGVYGPPGSSTVVPGSPSTLGSGGPLNLPSLGNAVTAAANVNQNGPTSPVNPGDTTQPDAQGAVNYAMSKMGAPYVWAAGGPAAFDCSGFVSAAYASIGVNVPHYTGNIAAMSGRVPYPTQPGDLIVSPARDHVVMWLGGNQIIEASGNVHIKPQYYDLSQCAIIHVCNNSGNPAAPFNPAATASGGGGSGGTGYSGDPTGGSSQNMGSEPIARNLFSYMFQPGMFATQVADFFTGEKAFIDDQPLIQMIQAICKAGLRNFASAPTGEFIAYYPDWFGLDGKQAVLQLQDIEMKDVRINYSDDPLTTHVYIAGDMTMQGQVQQPLGWLDTCGVVTVEDQWLYDRLTRIEPGAVMDPTTLMNRFGVRPYKEEYALAASHALEFLIAAHLFMLKWAEQYQTHVEFTWMPELFPGMRVQLVNHNLQVYVTEVTHTFDMESGFSTSAEIMAPSTLGAAANVMGNVQSVTSQIPAVSSPSNFVGFLN